MAYAPGHKKIGGRTKGTLNKATSIKEALKSFDFEKEFNENYDRLDPQAKMNVLKWLAEYMFAKRRAEDSDGSTENTQIYLEKPTPEEIAEAIEIAKKNER